MIRFGRTTFFLLASALGCATEAQTPARGRLQVQNRTSPKAFAAQRIVALPPQVVLYELDAASRRTMLLEVGGGLEDEARAHLESVMAENGDHVVAREELAACHMPCAQLFRWGTDATFDIGLNQAHIRNSGRTWVMEWKFPGDLAAVRQTLNADFALFVVLKQTRETAGRQTAKLVSAMGSGQILTLVNKQVDVACVADLRDGGMSWCTTDVDDATDIANPGQIATVMRRLLGRAFVLPARH